MGLIYLPSLKVDIGDDDNETPLNLTTTNTILRCLVSMENVTLFLKSQNDIPLYVKNTYIMWAQKDGMSFLYLISFPYSSPPVFMVE